jgi:hypothetical protein
MLARQKPNAIVIASYAVACIAVGLCLYLVTARYESVEEIAENQQTDGILNRQINDVAFRLQTEVVGALARDIAQDFKTKRLVEVNDSASLKLALPDLWRRGSVTSGAINLLGITIVRADGSIFASEGGFPLDSGMGVQTFVTEYEGIDRLKIKARTWVWDGRPILTAVHPLAGIRPSGYVVVHTDPLSAISDLDRQLGTKIAFWSLDHTKQLATLQNWASASPSQLRSAEILIRTPDGAPLMRAVVGRDVAGQVAAMATIRF